ncbi:hypothetical protein pb186bvf_013617 [Paramecium bursaria]
MDQIIKQNTMLIFQFLIQELGQSIIVDLNNIGGSLTFIYLFIERNIFYNQESLEEDYSQNPKEIIYWNNQSRSSHTNKLAQQRRIRCCDFGVLKKQDCPNKRNNYQTIYINHQNRKKHYQATIKITIIKSNANPLVQKNSKSNYKELYIHLIKALQLLPNQLYKGNQIVKGLLMKSCQQQFTRYFQFYLIQKKSNKIKWISNSYIKLQIINLFFFLANLLIYINSNEILTLDIDDNQIKIEFYVIYNISQYNITQINKILYHIGYYLINQQYIPILNTIELILIDKNGLEKYYL